MDFRDQAIAKNTINDMNKYVSQIGIVIIGNAHLQGVLKNLQDENCNVKVLNTTINVGQDERGFCSKEDNIKHLLSARERVQSVIDTYQTEDKDIIQFGDLGQFIKNTLKGNSTELESEQEHKSDIQVLSTQSVEQKSLGLPSLITKDSSEEWQCRHNLVTNLNNLDISPDTNLEEYRRIIVSHAYKLREEENVTTNKDVRQKSGGNQGGCSIM